MSFLPTGGACNQSRFGEGGGRDSENPALQTKLFAYGRLGRVSSREWKNTHREVDPRTTRGVKLDLESVRVSFVPPQLPSTPHPGRCGNTAHHTKSPEQRLRETHSCWIKMHTTRGVH